LFKLLDLAPLAFDFLLLLIDLALGLRLLSFLVLHLVAYGEAADAAQRTADCGSRARRTNRGTNNCASRRAEAASDQGAFFPGTKRLSAASHCSNQHRQTKHTDSDTPARPEHVNPPEGESLVIQWN